MKAAKAILICFIILLTIASAMAQNDPGHDTLYIEEQGDSEINGSLNTTQNFTSEGGEVEISNQFEIRGDGSLPGTNTNFIVANHDNWISISSKGNGKVIKLNDQIAAGQVLIGEGGNTNDLNVTNDVFILGSLLTIDSNFQLRTDGTFPGTSINSIVVNETAANAKMWLTSEEIILARGTTTGMVRIGETSSDSVVLNVTGDLIVGDANGFINGSQICTPANGLCGGAGDPSSAGGWTNTSTLVSLVDSTNNVSANALFVDNTNGRVGVGTAGPATVLDVNGTSTFNNQLNFPGSLIIDSSGQLSDSNSNVIVSDSLTVTSNLLVEGDNIDSSGAPLVLNDVANQPVQIGGTTFDTATGDGDLGVTGDIEANGILDIDGTETSSIAGGLDVGQNITVTGGGIYDSGATARIRFESNKVIIALG